MWTDRYQNRRRHSLVTKALGRKIPALGKMTLSETATTDDRVPVVKLFTPMSSWTWYILEWDEETGECYGLVQGFAQEFGYFNLDDLAEVRAGNLPIMAVERDCYWTPQTIEEIKEDWHDPDLIAED